MGAPYGWIPTVTSFPRNDNRVGHPHPNGYSFRAYLLTECATSKTEHEPQGGEKANAEHCSNGIAVMAIAPNVIPRSEATWKSPK